jgi:DNA-binding CsgD family transcriptional regulator
MTERHPRATRPTEQRHHEDLELLRALAAGHTLTAAGRTLGINANTAHMRAQRLYRRLGARNATNAVHIGHLRGLLGVDEHGNRPDTCGMCTLVPAWNGWTRARQATCPTHGSQPSTQEASRV